MTDAIFISEGNMTYCHECLKQVSVVPKFGFSVSSLLFTMKILVWSGLYQVSLQCYDKAGAFAEI